MKKTILMECNVFQPPANFRQSTRLVISYADESESSDESDNSDVFTLISRILAIFGKGKTM